MRETQAPSWFSDCRLVLRLEILGKVTELMPTILLPYWNYPVHTAILNMARPANRCNLAAFPGGVAKCGVWSAAGQFHPRPGYSVISKTEEKCLYNTQYNLFSLSLTPLLRLWLVQKKQKSCVLSHREEWIAAYMLLNENINDTFFHLHLFWGIQRLRCRSQVLVWVKHYM